MAKKSTKNDDKKDVDDKASSKKVKIVEEDSVEVKQKVVESCIRVLDDKKFTVIDKNYTRVALIKNTHKSEEDIENSLCELVYNVISESITSKDKKSDFQRTRKKLSNTIWITKSRWLKKVEESLEKKSGTFLDKELNDLRADLVNKAQHNIEEINNEVEKRKEDVLKELREWVSSVSNNISNFRYLDQMTPKQIKSAFEKDILSSIIESILDRYNGDLNNTIIKSFSNLPTGLLGERTRGRKPRSFFDMIKIERTKSSSSISVTSMSLKSKNHNGEEKKSWYKFGEGLIDPNADNEKARVSKMLKKIGNNDDKLKSKLVLDERDAEIQNFILSKAQDGEGLSISSYIYIADLIKACKLRDSGAVYKDIEDRLNKLCGYIYYEETIKSDGSIKKDSMTLFKRVTIETNESGKRIATIKLNEEIVEKDLRIDVLYKDEIEKLEYKHSKNLAFYLEGVKNNAIRSGKCLKDCYINCHIDSIAFKVYMKRSDSHKKNMSYLQSAFEDIKQNQFIIKDYIVGESSFDVLFYDDTEIRYTVLKKKINGIKNELKNGQQNNITQGNIIGIEGSNVIEVNDYKIIEQNV